MMLNRNRRFGYLRVGHPFCRFAAAWLLAIGIWLSAAGGVQAQALLALGPEETASSQRGLRPTTKIFATGFVGPANIVMSRDGTLIGANYRQRGGIGQIAPDWTAQIIITAQQIQNGGDNPPDLTGLALDKEGRLLILDAANGKVLRWTPRSQQLATLVDRLDGRRFHALFAITVDDAGNLYFTESSSGKDQPQSGSVYRYDIATNRTTRLVSSLDQPTGVAVSRDGTWLWVAESRRRAIRAIPLRQGLATDRVTEILLDEPKKLQAEDSPEDRLGHLLVGDDERLFVAQPDRGTVAIVDSDSGELLQTIASGGDTMYGLALHGDSLFTTVPSKEAIFQTSLSPAPGHSDDP